MDRQEIQDKLVDYLYDELSQTEKKAYQEYLLSHPEEAAELKSLTRLRKIYQEHLPEIRPNHSFEKNLFQDLGLRRPWYVSLASSFLFRPAIAGILVLALTLGLSYEIHQRRNSSSITVQPMIAQQVPAPRISQPAEDLNREDLLVAARSLEPRLQVPTWRSQPHVGNGLVGSGLVSFASYGSPSMPQSYGEVVNDDIKNLDQETELAIAQFIHQKALHMRAMGDFEGAAKEFAELIKKHPSYPHILEAAAQRIDCLFRIGQTDIARKELTWLGAQAPSLAQLLQQRWGI
jgi:hypothetical protein